MVVLGRICWIEQQFQAGATIAVSISHNVSLSRSKITFRLTGSQGRGACSPFTWDCLQQLRRHYAAAHTDVCDGGHRHSDGMSVANFWIRYRSPRTEDFQGPEDRRGPEGYLSQQVESEHFGNVQFDTERFGNEQIGNQQFGIEQVDTAQFDTERPSNEQFGDEHFGYEQFGIRQFDTEQSDTERLSNEQLGTEQLSNEQFRNQQLGIEHFGIVQFDTEQYCVENDSAGEAPGASHCVERTTLLTLSKQEIDQAQAAAACDARAAQEAAAAQAAMADQLRRRQEEKQRLAREDAHRIIQAAELQVQALVGRECHEAREAREAREVREAAPLKSCLKKQVPHQEAGQSNGGKGTGANG
eukprot:TRINITY_DN8370_c0_g1_i2.p1 TRINITY_DN8370_c0_g1~~TRINITY_DN8370_c0_g1_i2.p1  ORF type:complete len:357 (+),score=67.66 TRINITY_DN8370_c0_g1_i2:69-1139(+)